VINQRINHLREEPLNIMIHAYVPYESSLGISYVFEVNFFTCVTNLKIKCSMRQIVKSHVAHAMSRCTLQFIVKTQPTVLLVAWCGHCMLGVYYSLIGAHIYRRFWRIWEVLFSDISQFSCRFTMKKLSFGDEKSLSILHKLHLKIDCFHKNQI
jgi:hypothetical protein